MCVYIFATSSSRKREKEQYPTTENTRRAARNKSRLIAARSVRRIIFATMRAGSSDSVLNKHVYICWHSSLVVEKWHKRVRSGEEGCAGCRERESKMATLSGWMERGEYACQAATAEGEGERMSNRGREREVSREVD